MHKWTVLIGEPGTGKTTAAVRMAVRSGYAYLVSCKAMVSHIAKIARQIIKEEKNVSPVWNGYPLPIFAADVKSGGEATTLIASTTAYPGLVIDILPLSIRENAFEVANYRIGGHIVVVAYPDNPAWALFGHNHSINNVTVRWFTKKYVEW